MITHPVSRYLTCFEIEADIQQPVVYDDALQPLSAEPEPEPQHERRQDDREALLQAARDEGRAEGHSHGLAVAQAHYDAIIAKQKIDYERHLAEERNRWITEESTVLTLGFKTALQLFSDEFAESVDAILRPFIIDALRRQMVDELAKDIRILLTDEENPAIIISGAADLLAILKDQLSSASIAIEYTPDASIDVRIVSHHTIIESQLRAWIQRFEPPKE